jgi:hypothetical protein
VGRIAERFGVRPSEVAAGELGDLLFDARVLKELARDDEKALRRMRRRAGRV